MKILPNLILIVLIVSFPLFAASQTELPAASPAGTDFNVKNVRLGTNYPEVIKNLGKPLKSRKMKKEICGEDTHLVLDYPGLEIDLAAGEKPDEFIVLEIEITSSKWTIEPMFSIGSSMSAVRAKLGTPWQQDEKQGGIATLNYLTKGNDLADLYFLNDKLTKVRLWINPC